MKLHSSVRETISRYQLHCPTINLPKLLSFFKCKLDHFVIYNNYFVLRKRSNHFKLWGEMMLDGLFARVLQL